MPKVKSLIETLQNCFDPEETIAFDLWSTEDIISMAHDIDKDFSISDANSILEHINGDAYKMRWDYVRQVIEEDF